MKSLLAGFAALVATVILLPSSASADQLSFIGRCSSCGVPMYGQTIVAGYDRCGHPILRTIPVGHSCSRGYRDRDHHHGSHGSYGSYGSYGYGSYGYGYGRSGCDSRPRTGFSISIYR